MADISDYTGLITSEHQPRPKFMAVIAAISQPIVDQINTLLGMPAQFDLDNAVGAQLDVVGEWVGISRRVAIPLIEYSDSGPVDPTPQITTLDDDTYRLWILAKIAANNWDGTASSLASLLQLVFPSSSGTRIFFEDGFDMTMTIGIANATPSITFLTLLIYAYLPIKPAGVRVWSYEITSEYGMRVFGFDLDNEYVGGFEEAAWGTDDLYQIAVNLHFVSEVGPVANDVATLVNVTLPAATA
ncbi:TPA: DUF2612 domain-containing protein [Burkholderia vietnamiensis]|nr:DUF2612 domain-containing protein [Burkholderia vietnamiensis]